MTRAPGGRPAGGPASMPLSGMPRASGRDAPRASPGSPGCGSGSRAPRTRPAGTRRPLRGGPPRAEDDHRCSREADPEILAHAGGDAVAVRVEPAPARALEQQRVDGAGLDRARVERETRPTASTLCGTVRLTPRNPHPRMRSRAAGRRSGSTSNAWYRHPANRASARASSARAALCICGLSEWPIGWPITARPVPARGQLSRSDRVGRIQDCR